MKKLKKFVLNDARVLSREELASIEGALTVNAADYCTMATNGQACVYYIGYDGSGHSMLILGVCRVSYKQDGKYLVPDYVYCV